MSGLFAAAGDRTMPVELIQSTLARNHYLGPAPNALFAWGDDFGCMAFANPRSRRLPAEWLELVRWCLTGQRDGGSRQWASFVRYAREHLPATTVISYSDPAQGHTGALYRACGWLWAPTWHRLRPPPTGNGAWAGDDGQGVKDRWVYPLRQDARREALLAINDLAVERRFPWASYREPRWRGQRFDPATGGGDFRRWQKEQGDGRG